MIIPKDLTQENVCKWYEKFCVSERCYGCFDGTVYKLIEGKVAKSLTREFLDCVYSNIKQDSKNQIIDETKLKEIMGGEQLHLYQSDIIQGIWYDVIVDLKGDFEYWIRENYLPNCESETQCARYFEQLDRDFNCYGDCYECKYVEECPSGKLRNWTEEVVEECGFKIDLPSILKSKNNIEFVISEEKLQDFFDLNPKLKSEISKEFVNYTGKKDLILCAAITTDDFISLLAKTKTLVEIEGCELAGFIDQTSKQNLVSEFSSGKLSNITFPISMTDRYISTSLRNVDVDMDYKKYFNKTCFNLFGIGTELMLDSESLYSGVAKTLKV